MGKMKAYMMDLQEEADYAIQEGANSAGEVIMHIRNSGMSNVDEHWVTKYYEDYGDWLRPSELMRSLAKSGKGFRDHKNL